MAAGATVRFGWGAAAATGGGDAALVVVDVLSFSTAVTVAVGRGMRVIPHPWPAPGLDAFARAHAAVSAVPRHAVDADHPWSLSPLQLRQGPVASRLVLPSANGSSITAAAAAAAAGAARRVVAGCLRNATSVAQWLDSHWSCHPDRHVVVVAAGEHRPDGGYRHALEDLLGAGAVIAALPARCTRSPEAQAAQAAWRASRHHVLEALTGSVSGRELTEAGHGGDVRLAAEHDADTTVPVLLDGAFGPAPPAI